MDLAQEAQDAAAAAAAAWARDRPAASSREAAAADDDECHAVIRIDHMNDSSGYVKKLQRWCAQLGLAARLFYALPGGGAGFSAGGDDDPEASAERFRGSGSVGPPPGGRVEGVFVVLGGDGDSVQTFLTRLRTEMVDVDAKGNKCRERQSTTLCRRRADRTKTGQERVPISTGSSASVRGGQRRAGEASREIQPVARRRGDGTIPGEGGVKRASRARILHRPWTATAAASANSEVTQSKKPTRSARGHRRTLDLRLLRVGGCTLARDEARLGTCLGRQRVAAPLRRGA